MGRRAANVDLPPPPRKGPNPILRNLRIGFSVVAVLSILVGCLWAAITVEQFVVSDKRFILQGPPEPGVEGESFQITGVAHTSEQKVINTFSRDFGRSIYLCPIEERRRQLLAIDWIHDATVTRIWPNRLAVHLREREPVAFVQMPGAGGAMFYSLIDADGVLLDPRHAGQLALPVIVGIPAKLADEARRDRVRRFVRLQTELGQLMDKISEVDVSDIENLKVIQAFEGRALTLMLGNQKFLQRYQSFLDNYAEIRRRLPGATILDLRLTDRITAVGQTEAAPSAESAPSEGVRR